MKLSIGKKISLINLLTILIFLIVCIGVFINIWRMRVTQDSVVHTYKVIMKGEKLVALLVDQETGMRGFLTTGSEEYLEPYNLGKSEFELIIDDLINTVNDDPRQVEMLKEIKLHTEEWDLQVAAELINIRRSINDFDSINKTILNRLTSGSGKLKMDNFRNAIEPYLSNDTAIMIQTDMINMETGLRGYLATRDEVFLEPFYLGKQNISRNLTDLNSEGISLLANDWIENYAEKQIFDMKEASKHKNRDDLDNKLGENIGKELMDELRADIAEFVQVESGLLEERIALSDFSRQVSQLLLLFSALLATGIGITFSFLISRNITRALGCEPVEIMSISESIASGDLTYDYPEKKVIGAYSSMKKMSESLIALIKEVKTSTAHLENLGLDLSSSAEESSASLSMVSNNLASINSDIKNQNSSMDEITSSVTQISGNIESLNSTILDQSSQVIESSSAVQEMVSSINSVSENMHDVFNSTITLSTASKEGYDKMTRSYEQILKIAEESKKLMETNQMISGIASQTNLLSMNAAIEAAHAGEAGKGFSVVADEIRKLAESSSQQSHDVADMLKVVENLIMDIVESSRETVESFETIQEMINTVNQRSDEINQAMMEQSSGSQQILESLSSMTDLTENVKSGASEIQNGSALILNEMVKLKQKSADNEIRINEITINTGEINQSVENVMKSSLTNKEMVDSIVSELAFFKTSSDGDHQKNKGVKTDFEVTPVDAEVRGNIVSLTGALMSAYPALQKQANQILFEKTGKNWDEIGIEDWVDTYIWHQFMDVYSKGSIAGDRSLITLGRKIYPTIKKSGGLPPEMDSALKVLIMECETFLDYHRGADVEKRRILKAEEGNFIVNAKSPGYTCKVIEGVYMGILELFGIETGMVNQTECVCDGDQSCVFDVRW